MPNVPTYDPELEEPMRRYLNRPATEEPSAETLIRAAVAGSTVVATDLTLDGTDGGRRISATMFRDTAYPEDVRLPVIYYLHGGGLVAGTRGRVAGVLTALARHGCVGFTIDYGLAPIHPFEEAVGDCHAGLLGLLEADLPIDPDRIVVGGASAGGGLAASLAIAVRDRGGPRIRAQLLDSPMLDDRGDTVSAHQYESTGVWSREQNAAAWSAAQPSGSSAAFPVPARAASYAGLPPAYLSVGSAEVFRDEVVSFADRVWREGGAAELHVWSGAPHAFEALAPDAVVTNASFETKLSWLRRVGCLA